MDSVADRFRTRLLPALIVAAGVALLGSGLLSYASAADVPEARALPIHEALPTIDPTIVLPAGGGSPEASFFPPDRVATRLVIARIGIDIPVVYQPPEAGPYPFCDVAMYYPSLGQPGSGRATYIFAHSQPGMFLPLLNASKDHNGQNLIGVTVQVYTSDNMLFLYRISEVRRHIHSVAAAFDDHVGRLWLQASEGPWDSSPKLQVIADFVSSSPVDPKAAHPEAHPRQCVWHP